MKNYKLNIKKWYKDIFPDDDIVSAIKDNVTFKDIYNCLNAHENFYAAIGTGDSVVRERIFEKLRDLLSANGHKVEYSDIYQTWLGDRKTILEG